MSTSPVNPTSAYLKFLQSMAPPPSPNEVSAIIKGPRGASHGEWKGFLCKSASELHGYINLADGVGRTEEDIPLSEIWPLVYLRRFFVNRRSRKRGHGTRGMNEFLDAARKKGARIAFVWIGRDFGEDLEENREFYISKGWKIIPADSEYEPILAYYEL